MLYNSIITKDNKKTNKEIRQKIAEIRLIVDTDKLIWYNNYVFLKGGTVLCQRLPECFFPIQTFAYTLLNIFAGTVGGLTTAETIGGTERTSLLLTPYI